jgi:O-antigen/teichoic acid export membrane protein
LRAFGESLYGYWGSLLSFTSYLGLLNLGIAQTVSSKVSVAEGRGAANIRAIPNTGLVAFARVLLPSAIALTLVASWVPWASLFGLPAADADIARYGALAVLICFLTPLPLSVFRSALYGLGAVASERVIFIGSLCLRLLVAWWCAQTRPPLWLAVIALGGVEVVGSLACMFVFWRRTDDDEDVTDDATSEGRAARPSVREFYRPGAHFLMLQVAGAVVWSTDPMLAGLTIGTEAAARVAIAWRILMMLYAAGDLVGRSIAPSLAQAWASGERAKAADIGVSATQVALGLIVGGVMVLLVSGEQLISLWVGDLYIGDATWFAYCAITVLQALLVIPHSFVMQVGRHERYARFSLLEAAIKIAVSVLLIPRVGLVALPLGTLVGRVCTTLWVLPAVYTRTVDLPLFQWLGRVLKPLPVPIVVFASTVFLGRALLPSGNAWFELGLSAAAGLCYLFALVGFGIDPQLRARMMRLK